MTDAFSSQSLESLLAHSAWVRGLARSLVLDQDQVDELVQKTWIAAWKAQAQRIHNPKAWLGTVIRNFARQSHREQSSREARERESAREEAVPAGSDLVEQADLQAKLARYAVELAEPYRSTLLLHFFEDLSSAQIAKKLGIPDSTVRNRLKRALDQLRERLDRENRGNRRAWCLAMIPLALPKGLIAMGSKTIAGIAVAAALLMTGVGVWVANAPEKPAKTVQIVARPTYSGPPSELLAAKNEETPELGRRSLPVSEPLRQGLELVVRHPEGQPGSGIRLVVAKKSSTNGYDLHAQETTDERGEAHFAPFEGEGLVFIFDGNPRLESSDTTVSKGMLREIVQGHGRQEIRLPQGESISGTVFVDGKTPEKPIKIVLRDEIEPNVAVIKNSSPSAILNPAIGKALYWGELHEALQTRRDGRFFISGLRKDWRGKVGFAEKFQLVSPKDAIVQARLEPYEIHLRELPVIRGLVLASPDSLPQVAAEIEFRATGSRQRSFFLLSDDGEFEVPITETSKLQHVTVRFARGSSSLGRVIEFDVDGTRSVDLGKIELENMPGISCRVTDLRGTPIRGAKLGAHRNSATTDENGFATLPVEASLREYVTCTAAGYLEEMVKIPKDRGTIEIVLQPCTLLAIRLRARGDEAEGLQIRLFSEDRLMEKLLLPRVEEPWGSHMSAQQSEQGSEIVIRPRPHEPLFTENREYLHISGLMPNTDFRVQALDSLGKLVQEKTLALSPTAKTVVELSIAKSSLHSLDLTVVDQDENPVGQAEVFVEGLAEGRFFTNPQGHCKIQGISAERTSLLATRPGYCAIVVDHLSMLNRDGSRVMMPRGPKVDVIVADERGEPVPIEHLSWKPDGSSFPFIPAWRDSAKQFSIPTLVGRAARLQATIAGIQIEQVCEPGSHEFRFLVPSPGNLEIEIGIPLDFKAERHRLIVFKLSKTTPPTNEFFSSIDLRPEEGSSPLRQRVPLLLPGKYQAVLVSDRNEAGLAPRSIGPREIEIQAGKTAILKFD